MELIIRIAVCLVGLVVFWAVYRLATAIHQWFTARVQRDHKIK